ncbi:MAG: adenosylcobinamide-GDP ribazoletransferase [Victivallaceae bacterium]|nr:adenosylcobinamide-GDP ribazoletransferase [Victivallaceae bacterium]
MINFIKTFFRRFFATVTFLTIIPVPGYHPTEEDIAHGKPYFPLVGLAVGLIASGIARGLLSFAPPALVAAIMAVLLAAASKGFHLDGLADTADGFCSSRPREQVLEIMRDSRIGSMGVLALISVLGLKTVGLVSLPADKIPAATLFAAVAGRCGMAFYASISKYAREEGLGKTAFRYQSPWCSIWTLGFMAVTGYVLFACRGLVLAAAVALFVLLWSLFTRRQIGGATGDTLGACEEICEMLIPVILGCAYG